MKKFKLGMLALAAYSFAASVYAGEAPVFTVPEPGVLGLLAAGVAVAVVVRLRKRK